MGSFQCSAVRGWRAGRGSMVAVSRKSKEELVRAALLWQRQH